MRDISQWMPKAEERVLCGVSGGLDSMVLLELLRTWCAAHGGSVAAAHYNHHLRPAAPRDERFVRDWCDRHGISFVSGGADVRGYAVREGLSIEEAARKLRYAFLRREAASRGNVRIYVAHHAGDNAETILWNLIRGTGPRGLSGMSHEQGGIVRPLLDVPRAELEAYARARRIPHVEDETNADPDAASRNLLRLEVMPLLRRLNAKAEEHLCAAGERVTALQAFAEAETRRRTDRAEVRTGYAAIPARTLSDAPPELRPLILLDLLERTGAGRKDVGSVHVRAALDLLDAGNGKRADLPHGVTASVRDGWFLLETRPALEERELFPGVPLRWGPYELTLTDHVAGDGIALRTARAGEPDTVSVRPCPAGARLTLPGSRGSRTVKRLCADRGVSLRDRDALPALYLGGQLAAVWRIGTDAAFVPNGPQCRFVRVREGGISSLWETTENFRKEAYNL